MSVLYISDLDGTLLNGNVEISKRSVRIINSLTKKGLLFSIATARTAATVVKITEGLDMRLPVILMNGALIYDIKSGKYIKKEPIPPQAVKTTARLMEKHGINGFAYTVENDKMLAYYDRLATQQMREFYEERRSRFNKPFKQLDSMALLPDHDVVYFSFLNTEQRLLPLYRELKNEHGINTVFYRDIYNTDMWYLELLSSRASKKESALFLKQYSGADSLVCFGDNLNDLPMFSISDKSLAVANAHDDVKNIADEVIGSNENDGVALWLLEYFGQ